MRERVWWLNLLWQTLDGTWAYQILTAHTLNLHNVICQLYASKAGVKKEQLPLSSGDPLLWGEAACLEFPCSILWGLGGSASSSISPPEIFCSLSISLQAASSIRLTHWLWLAFSDPGYDSGCKMIVVQVFSELWPKKVLWGWSPLVGPHWPGVYFWGPSV